MIKNSKIPFFIVNPISGGGLGKKLWSKISSKISGELQKKVGNFDFEETARVGHARTLARKAAHAGYSMVVAFGGDGTIHEVVNGLYEAPPSSRPPLGILSAGTGGDFIKTLGLPPTLSQQMDILAGNSTQWIDLGHIEFINFESKKESRVFVNIADAGLGGEVVRILHRSRQTFGRRLAYLASTIKAYSSWRPAKLHITTDRDTKNNFHSSKKWPEKPLCVIIANGQYFGGGMPISPTSSLDDGYFDLIVVRSMNPIFVPLALSLLYTKQFLRLPHVYSDRVKSVTLEGEGRTSLDIDGESIGSLPATFKILPRTLEVKI